MSVAAHGQAPASAMPKHIEEGLRAIGRVIDPPATAALYAPLHDKEPYRGVKVTRDIKYGPAERNRLDIFIADGARGPLPVLMFVHGGGFTGGDKYTAGSPFYDNIPLWAARHGMVGVNMTYRLAPDAPWPAGPEDVGAATRWVIEHIAQHGGDPARVFVFGHSAGATHLAAYLAKPEFHGAGGLRLTGAILMSGIFDLTTFDPSPNYQSYFGADTSRYAERSSFTGLTGCKVPLMLVIAGLDPPRFIEQSETLRDAVAQRSGKAPRYVFLPKHSHISEGYAIGTDDTQLADEILEFVKTGR
jgi:triacylglycerol lipase